MDTGGVGRRGDLGVRELEPACDGNRADPTESLSVLYPRIARHFARPETRRRCLAFIHGLIGSQGRRNSRQIAACVGEARSDGMQRLLTTARWDAELVRDELCGFVVERVGHPAGSLVIDEAGFARKGRLSVGVDRQAAKIVDRTENCQVGVFLLYQTPDSQTIVDRELYLPPSWLRLTDRRREAGVPRRLAFRSKAQLGWLMVRRAIAAGVPAKWVVADAAIGHHRELAAKLDACGLNYVLGVRAADLPPLRTAYGSALPVPALLAQLPVGAWQYAEGDPSAPESGHGPWARLPIQTPLGAGYRRWLLVRRHRRRHLLFLCRADRATTLAQLVEVAGGLARSGRCLRSACESVGLNRYEVRLWTAWYRFMTLAMVAHASLNLPTRQIVD